MSLVAVKSIGGSACRAHADVGDVVMIRAEKVGNIELFFEHLYLLICEWMSFYLVLLHERY